MTRKLVLLSFFLCVFLLPQSIIAQDSLRLLVTIVGERECASAGDVNGDGFKDIVTGYYGDGGYIKVFLGGVNFDTIPDLKIMGNGGGFGRAVGCAGDLNKDGYDDIVVGAPWAYNHSNQAELAGKAQVFFGGSPMDTVVDVILQDSDYHYAYGSSVTSAGDVNDDGYDDVMVAAPDDSRGVGRVFIYLGGEDMDSIYDVRIEGHPDSSENLGWSVAGIDDINSDGYDDILIGSPWAGIPWGTGKASIYLGGDPMDSISDVSVWGDSINFWNFGRAVAYAGDVNGDGVGDMLIGGVSYAAKLLMTVSWSPELTLDTLNLFGEDTLPSAFGLRISAAGDINNDGFDDMLISDYQCGVDLKGKGYIFYGGEEMDSLWDVVLRGEESVGKQFGISVAHAGDVNGDTYDEILVASYGDSGYAGKIFIYTSVSTSLEDQSKKEELNSFHLGQNYPNPFNAETVIEYALPTNTQVKLSIYNILGQHIKTLIDECQKAGYKKVTWDGKDQRGREVSSGIYFYRIKTDRNVEVKKMLLLR